MQPTAPRVGSDPWQSGTGNADLSDYLQRVSETPVWRAIAERTLHALALQPGERALDVGCGTGVFLTLMSEAVGGTGQVIGIDHTQEFIEQAKERVAALGNVRLDHGDAYALPYADGSFDAAHCERVLMHLDDPTAALAEMRRVVRPGGRVVIAEPHWAGIEIDHPDHQAIEVLIREYTSRRLRQPWIGLELNRRLADAGLRPRAIEVLALTSFEYAEFVGYGLDLTWAADSAIASGQLERSRATAVLADLQSATREGTYFGFAPYMIARGEVP